MKFADVTPLTSIAPGKVSACDLRCHSHNWRRLITRGGKDDACTVRINSLPNTHVEMVAIRHHKCHVRQAEAPESAFLASRFRQRVHTTFGTLKCPAKQVRQKKKAACILERRRVSHIAA